MKILLFTLCAIGLNSIPHVQAQTMSAKGVGSIAQDAATSTLANSVSADLAQIIGRIATLEEKMEEVYIPGRVGAFFRNSCPEGWSVLANAEGRFIIGAGPYPMNADDDGSNSAVTYSLGDTGGRLDHQLLVNEIPEHSHEFEQAFYRYTQNGSSNNNKANKGFGRIAETSPAGGDQPHENRPPYLALLYCQKD